MAKVVIVSSFEFNRSDFNCNDGYSRIAVKIGNSLVKSGHIVVGLGISYNREQHSAAFGINQVPSPYIPIALRSLIKGAGFTHVIIVLDIPMIKGIHENINEKGDAKFIGVFAVEGDPITPSWAIFLSDLDYRFPISKFGEREITKIGLNSTFIPFTPDIQNWPMRTEEQKTLIKDTMGVGGKKLVFCNADNNERKNISNLFEAMKLLPDDYHLFLLTRRSSPVGWNFDDLLITLDITSKVTIMERGLSIDDMWKLYAMADLYIQPSVAEGLSLTVLEAMGAGIPVLCTNCTALTDHINNGRALGIKNDYTYLSPFGNCKRYVVQPETIANAILENSEKDHSVMIANARKYIEELNGVNYAQFFGEIF